MKSIKSIRRYRDDVSSVRRQRGKCECEACNMLALIRDTLTWVMDGSTEVDRHAEKVAEEAKMAARTWTR